MAGNRAVASLAPRMLSRQLVKDPKTVQKFMADAKPLWRAYR
jgi:hypothetical protein